ncbi:hypothetical protein [Acrocarpospora sp. B8E8]|uniref:hypothetical protein n=1 Tax=Acrocarpospora sp. B8E8 TaxID=3153572 RepID=UPI00325EF2D9
MNEVLDVTEVQLAHGCVTCTVRQDLLPQLVRHTGTTPLLIADLWDSVEPRSVAEVPAGEERLRLTRVLTALDAAELAERVDPATVNGTSTVFPGWIVTLSRSAWSQTPIPTDFLSLGSRSSWPVSVVKHVTAADWSGASFRGEEFGMSSTYDPGSFTPERCAAAIRAGVAAVLNDLTGIVIWLY